jgi:primary-amine oxidase
MAPCTVHQVNYEYCFYWSLYQDGTIDFQIKLTGELSTNVMSPGEEHPEYGILVMPGVNAQHHQHLFCARIDPAIDDAAGGADLVVSEVSGKVLGGCWDAS